MRVRSFPAWSLPALVRRRPTFGGSIGAAVVRGANLLLTWQERAEQRYRLAALDSVGLRDIGLSRADAAREAAKPFWRP